MRVTARGLVAALAVLVVAVVCVRLGFWQLDRLEQRRVLNTELATAADLPPLELDARGFREVRSNPDAHLYRRARLAGTYLHEHEVVLRGRAHAGRPGVHLVTPLRLDDGGGIVLVNRGWAPSPDAATVDPTPFREPHPRRAEGTLQWVPAATEESAPVPIEVQGATINTLRRLDFATFQARFDEPLLPLYVQLIPAGERIEEVPVRVPVPALDDGPHLGYAIQWFSFAGIAVFGFGYLVFTRRRREERVGGRPRERA